MKKLFILITALCFTGIATFAQTNKADSISLDLLKAPSSPAFNLLGLSPSQIDRPTDLNAFKVSLQNATNNFSKLPNSYSIEIAPASLLKLKNQTLDKLGSTSFKDVFLQSLSISFGSTHGNKFDKETNDSTSFSKLGFGIKFSIARPRFSGQTLTQISRLKTAQIALLNGADSAVNANDKVKNLKQEIKRNQHNLTLRKKLLDSLGALTNQLANEINNDTTNFTKIKNAVSNLIIERKGFFLDFAGGLALDFPTDQFDYSMVSKTGAWVTTGYEGGNNGLSILGIGRYLYQPDKIFADTTGLISTSHVSTFDAGARLLYNGLSGKFTASFETIYRSALTKNTVDPSWRYVLNLEYNVGKNQKLTFALGKDFNNMIKKEGNLITALNYIIGFGSGKQIN